MDLDDLKNLEICDTCRVLYMPKMAVDPTDYYQEEYPVNHTNCERCVKLD